MEFALEGILETLLVGVFCSLCLLSPLFLVVGHLFRLGPLQNMFMFLLYESDEEVTTKSTHDFGESYKVFAMLLLLAALFGLGVIAESFSKISELDLRKFAIGQSDRTIRLDALESVADSVLHSGQADEKFARFASDFLACRDLEKRNDHIYQNMESPCQVVIKRGSGFYYTAKNQVYGNDTRYQELSRLQVRIDFTRAVSMAFGILAVLWFMAFTVAFYAEWKREYILNDSSGWWNDLRRHWLSLSAWRCLLTGIFFLLFSYAVMFAWSDLEEYFDKRVFGYYLSNSLELKEAGDSDKNAAPPVLYPISAYHSFAGANPKQHFEPSAAARVGDLLLVANDKNPQEPLVQFPLGLDYVLGSPGKFIAMPQTQGFPDGFGKIESLHYSGSGSAGVLLAASNFDNEYTNAASIYRMEVENQGDAMSIHSISRLTLTSSPCSVLPENEGKGCIIEGMTSRDVEHEILLGVRFVFDKNGKKPTFAIIRLRPDTTERSAWAPELMMQTKLPEAFSHHGISSLEVAADGNLLVLTSVESHGRGEPTSGRTPYAIHQIMGALWRVDANTIAGKDTNWGATASPLFVFIHKPEGIALLDKSNALIVFDDDANRKGMAKVPSTFALAHHESVYTLVNISR